MYSLEAGFLKRDGRADRLGGQKDYKLFWSLCVASTKYVTFLVTLLTIYRPIVALMSL